MLPVRTRAGLGFRSLPQWAGVTLQGSRAAKVGVWGRRNGSPDNAASGRKRLLTRRCAWPGYSPRSQVESRPCPGTPRMLGGAILAEPSWVLPWVVSRAGAHDPRAGRMWPCSQRRDPRLREVAALAQRHLMPVLSTRQVLSPTERWVSPYGLGFRVQLHPVVLKWSWASSFAFSCLSFPL